MKSLLVQKYGGNCLKDSEAIRQVAEHVMSSVQSHTLVVVVSAMGDMTNSLIDLAHQTVDKVDGREMDMLLSTGERISMALLAMCLKQQGVSSVSLTGSQSGIITTSEPNAAKIIDIKPERIVEGLQRGDVVIVAGFQGVSQNKEVTTLGRGGSDTTAVALAAKLKAERCEIYTDVPGLCRADPRIVDKEFVCETLDYETAVQMSYLGAKFPPRALELAKKYEVPMRVTQVGGIEQTEVNKDITLSESFEIQAICSETGLHLLQYKREEAHRLEKSCERLWTVGSQCYGFFREREEASLEVNESSIDLGVYSRISFVGIDLLSHQGWKKSIIDLFEKEKIEISYQFLQMRQIDFYIKGNEVEALIKQISLDLFDKGI